MSTSNDEFPELSHRATYSPDSTRPRFEWKSGIQTIMDIGSQQIICLMGRGHEDGSLEIIGHSVCRSSGIQNGAITDIEKANIAVRNALTEAEKSSKHHIKDITVGFSGGHPASILYDCPIHIKGGVITQEDLDHAGRVIKQSVPIPHREILHIIPVNYKTEAVDHIINPIGHSCQNLLITVHIIYVDSAATADLRHVMEKAEVVLKDIVYTPLAAPLAVLDEQELKQGSTVIDIGSNLTSLVSLQNNRPLWTVQIKKGGASITHDIAIGLDMYFEDAEMLKTLFESPSSSPTIPYEYHHLGAQDQTVDITNNIQLEKIIGPRMRENLEQIAKELKNTYQDSSAIGNSQQASQHIVITGGGSLLDGIVTMAEDILIPSPYSPSRQAIPYSGKIHLGEPRIGGVIDDENLQPIFSTAVGLLIWALSKEKPFPDFVHPHKRKKRWYDFFFNFLSR